MHTICKPPKLPANGVIGVIAPASPVDEAKLNRGVIYLERLGYRVEIGESVTKKRGYLAGTDQDRLDDLHTMFRRKDIHAVFCARGGYGTPRLLDKIDYTLIRENPKIFVGYSDVTALQLALFRKTGLVTFSGPMVAVEFAAGILPQTEAWFWKLLTVDEPAGVLPPLHSVYTSAGAGVAEGRLMGGCLSVIASIAGTPYCPESDARILFFEEVGEEPYRIDRFLAQLRHVGLLDSIAGLVTGRLTDCNPANPARSLTATETLADYFDHTDLPRIHNFDYGHIPLKHTLPVGVSARIDAGMATVELLESAVTS